MDQQCINMTAHSRVEPSVTKDRVLDVPATDYGAGLGIAEMVVRVEMDGADRGSDAWVRLKRAADSIAELRFTAESKA